MELFDRPASGMNEKTWHNKAMKEAHVDVNTTSVADEGDKKRKC